MQHSFSIRSPSTKRSRSYTSTNLQATVRPLTSSAAAVPPCPFVSKTLSPSIQHQPQSHHSRITHRCSVKLAAASELPGVVKGSTSLRVLLTREEGKNVKLAAALAVHGFECIELPLIQHSLGADRAALPAVLQQQAFDWVVITSPEAAAVFLEGWQEAGCPVVRIAVVGGGTGEVLQQSGVTPEFVSSKAMGKTLGGELPRLPGGADTVLYPASSSASQVLQRSLQDSGFTVTRLNTYDTSSVVSVSPSQLQQAKDAEIITFGSPSAVKSWIALVGEEVASRKQYACIGSTSATASAKAGLVGVHFPESPGVEGWVTSVLRAREGCLGAKASQ